MVESNQSFGSRLKRGLRNSRPVEWVFQHWEIAFAILGAVVASLSLWWLLSRPVEQAYLTTEQVQKLIDWELKKQLQWFASFLGIGVLLYQIVKTKHINGRVFSLGFALIIAHITSFVQIIHEVRIVIRWERLLEYPMEKHLVSTWSWYQSLFFQSSGNLCFQGIFVFWFIVWSIFFVWGSLLLDRCRNSS